MAKKINKLKQSDYFTLLKHNKVTLKQHYLLYEQLINPSKPLNYITNNQKDLDDLHKKGLLIDYKVSPAGEEFLLTVERLFRGQTQLTSRQLMGDDYKEKILQYRNLFPNIKLKSGLAAWQSPEILETAFRWFFQKFTYDWATILKATQIYMIRQNNGDNQYCQTSQYFVRKNDKSTLSNICEEIRTGTRQTDEVKRKIKVV